MESWLYWVIVTMATLYLRPASALAMKERGVCRLAWACLGFSHDWIPFTNSLTQQSIYTFNSDGTGTVQGTHFGITFPPNQSTALRDMSWEFTYEVTQDGTITFVGEGIWKFPGTNDIAYTAAHFSGQGCRATTRPLRPVTPDAYSPSQRLCFKGNI
jgi:hypothetical protein